MVVVNLMRALAFPLGVILAMAIIFLVRVR
ncbi:hypothetical protein ES703_53593 [subsurface metagenome]